MPIGGEDCGVALEITPIRLQWIRIMRGVEKLGNEINEHWGRQQFVALPQETQGPMAIRCLIRGVDDDGAAVRQTAPSRSLAVAIALTHFIEQLAFRCCEAVETELGNLV